MSLKSEAGQKPLNPVQVSIVQEEGPSRFDNGGILFDHFGKQYRFRTNDDLVAGNRYIVDTELIDKMTVVITDSWNHTEYR